MSTSILQVLKQETSLLHKTAEEKNLAKYIIENSITLEQYIALIKQNYTLYKTLEDQLICNKELLPEPYQKFVSNKKSEALKKDLSNLNVFWEDTKSLAISFSDSFASVIGIMYVIEGSMLGGQVIKHHIQKCQSLQGIPEQFFFGDDSKAVRLRWNQFCDTLLKSSFTESEVRQSVLSAKKTFEYFIRVFSETEKKV
ncbi:biliverdin-producing heme oxygenase [Aquimarina spongiae]|uniref:Heme oxygenase n=1 Tax=Aquimarina spongiae TaxID=570521 RepID=A0A1M6GP05_9FLAO|nr:biliverdin-producing heme oxygenase [Aquimarina spongiae]SHJ11697.1 Heme oxygenase [Aquimarina spongiae]